MSPPANGVDYNALEKMADCLFAFVDLKDPFMPAGIAGEELPGPVMSIMMARHFDSLSLFHTPHTSTKALATECEVLQRNPGCRVTRHELPVSDPKDYSSLIAELRAAVTLLMRRPAENRYVCVSSGTAEMRAAWFSLATGGDLPATLLRIGLPATPLGQVVLEEVLDMRGGFFSKEKAQNITFAPRLEKAPTIVPQELTEHNMGGPYVSAAPRSQVPRSQPELESQPLPRLDKALQELGIYIGSAKLRDAAERAGIAADTDLPVLLLGETGTGKERFAHLIHRLSPRHKKEIVAINCAAVPKDIAESYFFGHVKGAFTGASIDKKGLFEGADQTTLFLDEIGELTLDVQAKLLRVLQDCAVQRLGSTALRRVDVRIIAATNRDLRKEVAERRFREDLYFRLEVIQINLPPLRERRNEIPDLALTILKQINQRRRNPRQLSREALLRLERCDWPGNVRQLSNVLQRSVLYGSSDILDADDLLISDVVPAKDPLASLPDPVEGFSVEDYLAQVRKQLFLRALAKCSGNQTEAAVLLRVSKQAVSKFVSGDQSTPVDGQ